MRLYEESNGKITNCIFMYMCINGAKRDELKRFIHASSNVRKRVYYGKLFKCYPAPLCVGED